jgi:hypothetical protein
MYMVGTPMNTCVSCSTMSASAASPSKRGTITMVAPARNDAFMVQVWPKVWNRGRQPRIRSPARRSKVSSSSTSTCMTSARWDPSAPFGWPVVPDV